MIRYVYAKQIPKLSEAVGGKMVASIGRLPKSSKIGEMEDSKKYSVKTIDKLEFSSYDAYKLTKSVKILIGVEVFTGGIAHEFIDEQAGKSKKIYHTRSASKLSAFAGEKLS